MPETKTQKPAFNSWAFIAAIMITIIFVGIILVWQNNAMEELKQEFASSQKQLETKVDTIENGVKKEAEAVEEDALDPTENWETFKIADYKFLYPNDWTYNEQESQQPGQTIYAFYDENDERVGLLFFPIPETGFESMQYDQKSRHYKKDGVLHKVFLWEGRPDLTEYPEYYETIPEKEMLIFMREADDTLDDYTGSSLLIIRNLDEETMVGIANSIYNSIE